MLKTIEIIEMPKQKWIVTSAWPYVNSVPHLGNIIGSVLSGDVFARYLRLQKNTEVLYVSGSDMHGTPIAVDAIKKGISSEELSSSLHEAILRIFNDWNLYYDNYTQTHNPTHIKFIQDFYLEVQKNGYIVEDEIEGYYCPEDDFFLPDRFIEGTCPHCGKSGARGINVTIPLVVGYLKQMNYRNPIVQYVLSKVNILLLYAKKLNIGIWIFHNLKINYANSFKITNISTKTQKLWFSTQLKKAYLEGQ